MEKERTMITMHSHGSLNVVHLNVGGKRFVTTTSTLGKYSESRHYFLGVAECPPTTREIFIDRNGNVFHFILDFLRKGHVNLPPEEHVIRDVLDEAAFFSLEPLVCHASRQLEALECKEQRQPAVGDASMTRTVPSSTSSFDSPAKRHHTEDDNGSEVGHPAAIPLIHRNPTVAGRSESADATEGVTLSTDPLALHVMMPSLFDSKSEAKCSTPPPDDRRTLLLPSLLESTSKLVSPSVLNSAERNRMMNDDPSPPSCSNVPLSFVGEREFRTDESF